MMKFIRIGKQFQGDFNSALTITASSVMKWSKPFYFVFDVVYMLIGKRDLFSNQQILDFYSKKIFSTSFIVALKTMQPTTMSNNRFECFAAHESMKNVSAKLSKVILQQLTL